MAGMEPLIEELERSYTELQELIGTVVSRVAGTVR